MIIGTFTEPGIKVFDCPYVPSFIGWRYKRAVSFLVIRVDGQVVYQKNPTNGLMRIDSILAKRTSFFYFKFAHGAIAKRCQIEVHFKGRRRMNIFSILTHQPRVDVVPDGL